MKSNINNNNNDNINNNPPSCSSSSSKPTYEGEVLPPPPSMYGSINDAAAFDKATTMPHAHKASAFSPRHKFFSQETRPLLVADSSSIQATAPTSSLSFSSPPPLLPPMRSSALLNVRDGHISHNFSRACFKAECTSFGKCLGLVGRMLRYSFATHATFVAYLLIVCLTVPLMFAPFVTLQTIDARVSLDGSVTAWTEGFYQDVSFYERIAPQNRTEAYAWKGVLKNLAADQLGRGVLETLFVVDAIFILLLIGGLAVLAMRRKTAHVQNKKWASILLAITSALLLLAGILFLCWVVFVPWLCFAIGQPMRKQHRERFEFEYNSESEDIQGKAWVDALGSASTRMTCSNPFGDQAQIVILVASVLAFLLHACLQVVLNAHNIRPRPFAQEEEEGV